MTHPDGDKINSKSIINKTTTKNTKCHTFGSQDTQKAILHKKTKPAFLYIDDYAEDGGPGEV